MTEASRGPGLRAALGVVVSAVLMWLLVRQVDPGGIAGAMAGVDPALLVAATVCHGAMLLLRIQRFAWLVGERGLASRAAFDSVFLGWLSNLALPAKAGELARPMAYARWSEAPLAKVVGALAAERMLDLLSLGVLFGGAVGLGLPVGLPEWVRTVAWLAGGGALFGLLGLIVVAGAVDPTRADLIGRFRTGLDGLRGRALVRSLGGSGAIWALETLCVVLTLRAVGLHVSGEVAASAVLVVATTLAVVPTAAPAGLGVEQWVAVLVLGAWAVGDAPAVAVSLLGLFQAVAWIGPVGVVVLVRRGARGR